MNTYGQLYERLVLIVWGVVEPWTDPFMLGSRVVFDTTPDNVSGEEGHHLKFGLSTALRRAAVLQEEQFEMILELDNRLWEAEIIDEICTILDQAEELLNGLSGS